MRQLTGSPQPRCGSPPTRMPLSDFLASQESRGSSLSMARRQSCLSAGTVPWEGAADLGLAFRGPGGRKELPEPALMASDGSDGRLPAATRTGHESSALRPSQNLPCFLCGA